MMVLVTATRLDKAQFDAQTLLGRCLPRLGQFQPLALRLSPCNTRPLGEVYNSAIEQAQPDDVLVFVHDDVHLDDWMLAVRLQQALRVYDVVGVAGNDRVQPGQPTWYLAPGPGPGAPAFDHPHLSGAIAHVSASGQSQVTVYGPSPRPVRLLDGVFLAASAGRLQQSGVRFDPELGFHFYDLDFCLSTHQAGLSLGTWPIALTHQSGGESIRSQAWRGARLKFERKWFS